MANFSRPKTSSSTSKPSTSTRNSEDSACKPSFIDAKPRRDQQATHSITSPTFPESQQSNPASPKESKISLKHMKFNLGKSTAQAKIKPPKRARSKIQKRNPNPAVDEAVASPLGYQWFRGPTGSLLRSSHDSKRSSRPSSLADSFDGSNTYDSESLPIPLKSIQAFKDDYVHPPLFPQRATSQKTSTRKPTSNQFSDFHFPSPRHDLFLSGNLSPLQLIPDNQSEGSASDSSKYFCVPENHPAIHDPNFITVYKSFDGTESLRKTESPTTLAPETIHEKDKQPSSPVLPPSNIPVCPTREAPTAPPQELEAASISLTSLIPIDPHALSLYDVYKTTDKITPCLSSTTTRTSSSPPPNDATWPLHASLLTAHIHDPTSSDRIIDTLSASIPHGIPADAGTIFYVFGVRGASSELKRFVVDRCVDAGEELLKRVDVGELPREFLELALKRAVGLVGKGGGEDGCRYHAHGRDEECYKVNEEEGGKVGEVEEVKESEGKAVEADKESDREGRVAKAVEVIETQSEARVADKVEARGVEAVPAKMINISEAQVGKVMKSSQIRIVQIPANRNGKTSPSGRTQREAQGGFDRHGGERSIGKETALIPDSSLKTLHPDGVAVKDDSAFRIVITSETDGVAEGSHGDGNRSASTWTSTHRTRTANSVSSPVKSTSLKTSTSKTSSISSDFLSVPPLRSSRLNNGARIATKHAHAHARRVPDSHPT
ncbi:hypothetical protein DM02DRAFT_634055 [Periconia macrospinosa]|uniref:Uncharacterized protein n=1 Tax=Periconia macrospinosa TaxID=97972 RepID=A0A2V1DA29_9PLEO|nr:hypothetical protein DM02DRAFT_634055 [Periconia macrospinosa]